MFRNPLANAVADVGTDLIDGHAFDPVFDLCNLALLMSAPT